LKMKLKQIRPKAICVFKEGDKPFMTEGKRFVYDVKAGHKIVLVYEIDFIGPIFTRLNGLSVKRKRSLNSPHCGSQSLITGKENILFIRRLF